MNDFARAHYFGLFNLIQGGITKVLKSLKFVLLKPVDTMILLVATRTTVELQPLKNVCT